MSAEWIEHNGRRILYLNYSGLSGAQCVDQFPQEDLLLAQVESGKRVLLMLHTDGIKPPKELAESGRERTDQYKKILSKMAWVGIGGIVGRSIFTMVNAFSSRNQFKAKAFANVLEAKKWLAS